MDIRDLIRLRKAKDRMDREFDRPLDVPALARSAAMSTGHFSRTFKAAFGESPYSYLMTRRIERAKLCSGGAICRSPKRASPSALHRWARSARASPNSSGTRPAPTARAATRRPRPSPLRHQGDDKTDQK